MRSTPAAVLASIVLLALVPSGCALQARSASPAGPPPVVIPAGCGENQSGAYVHAVDPRFHYLAQDDGGTLTLSRVLAPADAGTAPAPDPSGPRTRLERTSRGFVGATQVQHVTGSGYTCPVAFSAEVVACEKAGLVLRAAPSAQVDEACHLPQAGSAPMREQRLLREVAASTPAKDGG